MSATVSINPVELSAEKCQKRDETGSLQKWLINSLLGWLNAIRYSSAPTVYKSWPVFCIILSHHSCHTGSYQFSTWKFLDITRNVHSIRGLGNSANTLLWVFVSSREEEEEVRNLFVNASQCTWPLFLLDILCTLVWSSGRLMLQ